MGNQGNNEGGGRPGGGCGNIAGGQYNLDEAGTEVVTEAVVVVPATDSLLLVSIVLSWDVDFSVVEVSFSLEKVEALETSIASLR